MLGWSFFCLVGLQVFVGLLVVVFVLVFVFIVIYLCSGSAWNFTLQKHLNVSLFKCRAISFEVKLKIKKQINFKIFKCFNFPRNQPWVSILYQNNHRCEQLGKKADVSHCPALALCWHRRSLRSRILKRIPPKSCAVFPVFQFSTVECSRTLSAAVVQSCQLKSWLVLQCAATWVLYIQSWLCMNRDVHIDPLPSGTVCA